MLPVVAEASSDRLGQWRQEATVDQCSDDTGRPGQLGVISSQDRVQRAGVGAVYVQSERTARRVYECGVDGKNRRDKRLLSSLGWLMAICMQGVAECGSAT
jgi:hypothetical protein